jgi:asparagine synthase (glutamine-hydrolysing)
LPELAKIPYQRTGLPPKWPPVTHTIGFVIKGGYKFLTQKLREMTGGLINLPQKIGYPDLDECIRKDPETKDFFKSVLLDERTLARPYFNREFILKMLTEHMDGRRNWGFRLCALLTFELWNRYFVDVQ